MQIRLNLLKAILVVVALMLVISVSNAEDRVAGHWEGHIEIPGQPLAVKVDIAVNDAELLRKQNERIFDAMGMADARKQTLLTLVDRYFTAATSDMAEDELQQQVDEIVRKQFEINGIPAAQQDETHVPSCGGIELDSGLGAVGDGEAIRLMPRHARRRDTG